MTRVKVCGITNLDDARASVDAGAYALGFNFYPKSPRYIEPDEAAQIIEQLPTSLMTVGVFVNETEQSLRTIAATAGIKAVQLHGDETPLFCEGVNGFFVIKALRVNTEFDPAEASRFKTEAILLDSFSSGSFGGSGKTFDWEIARSTKAFTQKLFLAGGLSASNVKQAIDEVQPFAIDVCSSIERVPGRKDISKLSAFMKATKGQ